MSIHIKKCYQSYHGWIIKNEMSYLWLQVIHKYCKVGGVITLTGRGARGSEGHPATITGPSTGMIMPVETHRPEIF